ncbi:hypothetical protein MKK64_23800 [Methylobacterium sp. E-025]|uniref:hypothetical protein n=1 Tax=Methylobacterium sp. E-025 TaxID=2836561 RepID=UPI001FB971E3|nr:hypothetical protein [Methylobacterium sp. E-025]MCJ2114196.1 hypothetical protein [Methylobacterium sp. E-025]
MMPVAVPHHVAPVMVVPHHVPTMMVMAHAMAAMTVHAVHPDLSHGGRGIDGTDHAGGGRGGGDRSGTQGCQDGCGEKGFSHGLPQVVVGNASKTTAPEPWERLRFQDRSAGYVLLNLACLTEHSNSVALVGQPHFSTQLAITSNGTHPALAGH